MLHAPAGCVDLSNGPDIHWTCADGSELVSAALEEPPENFLAAVMALDRVAVDERRGVYARVEQRFYACRVDRREAACLHMTGASDRTFVVAPGVDRALRCWGDACPRLVEVDTISLSGQVMGDGFESFSVDGDEAMWAVADSYALRFRATSTTSSSAGLTCTIDGREAICLRIARPDGVAYVGAPTDGPRMLLVCTSTDPKELGVPAPCEGMLDIAMPGCDPRNVAFWVCGQEPRPSGGLSVSMVLGVLIDPASGAIPVDAVLGAMLPAEPRERVAMTFGGETREVMVGESNHGVRADVYVWDGPEGALACQDVSDDPLGRCTRWFETAFASLVHVPGDAVVAKYQPEPLAVPECPPGAHQAECGDGSWGDLSVVLVGSGRRPDYAAEIASEYAVVTLEPAFDCAVDGVAASCVRVDRVDETVLVAVSDANVALRCASSSPEAGIVPKACAGRLEF